jgi:hypothetical protein
MAQSITRDDYDPQDATASIIHLQAAVSFHSRFALGTGLPPETVAVVLESAAAAIRDPSSVAERMYPLTLENF